MHIVEIGDKLVGTSLTIEQIENKLLITFQQNSVSIFNNFTFKIIFLLDEAISVTLLVWLDF